MSKCKLSFLAILAAVSLIAAIAVNRITHKTPQASTGSIYLIQGLSPASIDKIKIKGNDKELLLQRVGENFVVTGKDNYPAQKGSINELITGLLDVQSLEMQTSNERNYADLGVTREDADSIVEFLNKDSQTITGMIFGKRTDEGNSYVRLVDGQDVYLCQNIPYIKTSDVDYIDRQLLDVKAEDINEVTVTDSNGLTYTLIAAKGSGDITLKTPIPQGKKLSAAHRQVFRAVAGFRFDDVMSEKSAPEKAAFDETYICKLKDSTAYILKLAKVEDKTYAKLTASFENNEKININSTAGDSEEEIDRKRNILLAREKVHKFNKICKDWIYEIPSYKAVNMTKPLSGILEDIEPPKTENTEE
jgi:hypothetical protein